MKTIRQTTAIITGTILLLSYGNTLFSQNKPSDSESKGILVKGVVVNGDTLPVVNLNTVVIEAEMSFATRRRREQWDAIRFNVRKVYPYAILASAKLREFENTLSGMSDEDKRDEYMEYAEAQLQKEFGNELKNLSVKQGKILIKLIDRQTGNTSYDLVKKLRGRFSAFMWQGMARLFGSNLKSEYDADGEDKLIEVAIRQIESGY